MTEPGNSSWFANNHSSPQAETEIMQDEADVNNSTYSKVKNFTSGETNDNIAAVLNILIDESKSTQKSIALVNRKICELSIFLLKDKKTQVRERRF